MLLTIDIGNTQTVLGLFEGAELAHTWRLSSDASRTADELKAFVTQLFYEAFRNAQTDLIIGQVVIASVVPALTRTWEDLIADISYFDAEHSADAEGSNVIIVGSDCAKKYSADIVNPSEIGADRIANAVAAARLYGAPAVVLDFGTATNIDVIDARGHYVGGIISPGLQTSANALFESAARLSAIDLELPEQVLGTTTKTAIQSGLLYGEAGKVEALIHALKKQLPMLKSSQVPVIATGGLAFVLAPLIDAVSVQDEHLTLKGLQLIAAGEKHGGMAGKGPGKMQDTSMEEPVHE